MFQHVAVAAITTACKIKIPESLQLKPLSAPEIAGQTYPRTDPESLERLLRLLVDYGVLTRTGGLYSLNPISELLLREHPRSMAGGFATQARVADVYFDLEKVLGEGCRTPRTMRRGSKQGQSLAEHCAGQLDVAQNYHQYVATQSAIHAEAVIADCPFGHVQKLVDVAGGTGALLRTVLEKYPQMQGVLVEQPHTLSAAVKHPRIQPVPCDMFCDTLPEADAYLLKTILCNWDDFQASALLRNIRRALSPSGKLYVCEAAVHEDPRSDPLSRNKLLTDVALLALGRGRERSRAQLETLLRESGFVVETVSPLRCVLDLIVAKPV